MLDLFNRRMKAHSSTDLVRTADAVRFPHRAAGAAMVVRSHTPRRRSGLADDTPLMRRGTGLLLIALLLFPAFEAIAARATGAKTCCCSKMGSTCPMRKHGRCSCSIDRQSPRDAGAVVAYDQVRCDSTASTQPFRLYAPRAVSASDLAGTALHARALAPPETPPPRRS
jgi:hypothetical protein